MNMACVLRENLPEEVAKFQADVWEGEPMFLDAQHQLFKAIGGGMPNETTREAFMKTVNDPNAEEKAQRERASKLAEGFLSPEHHNAVGQGFMMGGVYVLHKGGAVEWAHQEQYVGDTSDAADVVAAAGRATSAGKL